MAAARINSPQVIRRPQSLAGAVSVPGDKSIAHRALILNAIATGDALVTGLPSGEDVSATMRCLQALGVSIEPADEAGGYIVRGTSNGLEEPGDVLSAGESGTSMRLLSGLLAAQPFLSVLSGSGSLRSRPMGRVIQPLKQMGAQIMGRNNDTLAPFVIRGGGLQGIDYTMPVASAQVKSCIMLAGLTADGDTTLRQPALSRDHTERMLTAMGATVETEGLTLILHPARLKAVDVTVPGDISSAAFWLVAGLCHSDAQVVVRGVGLNPSRTGIIEVLQAMGAGEGLALVNERTEGGEPVADLMVAPCQLHGTEVCGEIIPRIIDELPVLAVAACFAEGTTVIRDARELRVKESDRVETTVGELTRMGAHIEAREDGMVIHGTGRLTGAHCESHNDHRLAMALGVAGILAHGETTVHGAETAAKSYPEFWQHLGSLTGQG